MSNLSAIALAITGFLSITFFIIASLKTDVEGVLDWSKEKFPDDKEG